MNIFIYILLKLLKFQTKIYNVPKENLLIAPQLQNRQIINIFNYEWHRERKKKENKKQTTYLLSGQLHSLGPLKIFLHIVCALLIITSQQQKKKLNKKKVKREGDIIFTFPLEKSSSIMCSGASYAGRVHDASERMHTAPRHQYIYTSR